MNINMDVIREVMAVAKRLDEKTLVNTFEGNISAKVDGKIYITPTTKNKRPVRRRRKGRQEGPDRHFQRLVSRGLLPGQRLHAHAG